MSLKCYLCDSEMKADPKLFKIGAREELICVSCYTKTINRRKAIDQQREG